MKILLADLETRSRVDLKAAGHRRYARDPSTSITTAAWMWKGSPNSLSGSIFIPGMSELGSHAPIDFIFALMEADLVVFHNAGFDASVIRETLKYDIPVSKLSCTMARAQRMSLPGGLDEIASALGVPGKSIGGNLLVMKTCKPQRDGTFCEDPDIFRDLLSYNLQDVRALADIDARLPELPPEERRIWERTWRKNEIGLPIDLQLAEAVAARREDIEAEVANDLRRATGGAVTKVTQRERIQKWLASIGCPPPTIIEDGKVKPSLRKEAVEEALERDDLPYDAYEVLSILVESGGTAPTKATALLNRHVGGFYKDHSRYFGARSGRGTSEGVNTFNIARPSGDYDIEAVIDCLKRGAHSGAIRIAKDASGQKVKNAPLQESTLGNVALTDVLRGLVCAPNGYEVIDADEANIELRLALWFAGDADRLAILGSGGDLYMHNAINGLGLPKDATKETHPQERQNFKTVTLGCLGPDTLVLTSNGTKPIVAVTTDDLLWDGLEWVCHGGLLDQGVKDVISPIPGLWATLDHGVLCGKTWIEANCLDESSIRLALASGSENLPSLATKSASEGASRTSSSGVTAGVTSSGCSRTLSETAGGLSAQGASWPELMPRPILNAGTQQTEGLSPTTENPSLSGVLSTGAEYTEPNESTSLRASAVGSEASPSPGTASVLAVVSRKFWSRATAVAQNMKSTFGTSNPNAHLAASRARYKNESTGLRNFTHMLTRCRKTITGSDSAIDYRQPSTDVTTQRTRSGRTTAGGESKYAKRGATIGGYFCCTFATLKGGTTQAWKWIGSITTWGTSPSTCSSSRANEMLRTVGKSPKCKKKSMTYDIAYAGPRNRFTVLTDAGPVIVHNCNYGLGHRKFYASQRRKIPGLTQEMAETWVAGYRRDNPKLAAKDGLWKNLDNAAREAFYRSGHIIETCDGKIAFCQSWENPWGSATDPVIRFGDSPTLWLRLPSGRAIPHYGPTVDRDSGEFSFFRGKHGRMLPQRAYGGSWTEISCQSAARDVLTHVEAQIEDELPDVTILMDIYDSSVSVARTEIAEACKNKILRIMARPIAWAPGLPLKGDGHAQQRMAK